MTSIFKLPGVGTATAAALSKHGIETAEQLAGTSPDILLAIPQIGPSRVKAMLAAAQKAKSEASVKNALDQVATRKPRRATAKAPAKSTLLAETKADPDQTVTQSEVSADITNYIGDPSSSETKSTKDARDTPARDRKTEVSKAEPGKTSGKAKKNQTDKKTAQKVDKKADKKAAAKKAKKKSAEKKGSKKKSKKSVPDKKNKRVDKKK